MTEYELYEIIVGYSGNLEQSMAVLISLSSAYLILAYTIGAKLSRFQVLFIRLEMTQFNVEWWLGRRDCGGGERLIE